jgi:hypothetical protein
MIGQIGVESAAIPRSPSLTGCSPRSVVVLMVICTGGQLGSKQATVATLYMAAAWISSEFAGLVGQELHRRPAVVETPSGMSSSVGDVATCRPASLSLSSDAAECRRMSAVTGADTGADQTFTNVHRRWGQ